MTKYIFITGGVVSSLGKGLASASIGALLQARGYKVRLRKLDPYLNIDPGTMSPHQHGEVFVTDDGMETDLDLGHYERFTNVNAKNGDSTTTGKIYSELLAKERRGDYLGATVQVIPHVTDLIKEFILKSDDEDFILCEIGGTVGDIEAQPYLESIRQLGYELGSDKAIFVHLTLIPYLRAAKEIKTKPTQHSVKELRTIGITPNILLCRTEKEVSEAEIDKIALFCNIKKENVIQAFDVKNLYEVPLEYHQQNLDTQILTEFGISMPPRADLTKWQSIKEHADKAEQEVNVAVICKYSKLIDAYKSVKEALYHAGLEEEVKIKIDWLNSKYLTESNVSERLKNYQAILVPGGFGVAGTVGKMLAIKYARENNIPFLGICFGMQLAAIEFAKNVCGLSKVSSSELDVNCEPLIGKIAEWQKDGELIKVEDQADIGGTMRLGAYECLLEADSLASQIYNSNVISERHRHRYEMNKKYAEKLASKGLTISGWSPDGKLPEIIELKNHRYYIAAQFHPEFKSRPFAAHPLFKHLIKAAKTLKGE